MFNFLNFIFLGTFGWGASLYLMKILLEVISPVEIVLYRSIIGSLTLAAFALFTAKKINNKKLLLRDGLMFGLLNIAIPFYLTVLAEQELTSSFASALNGLTPFFTVIISIVIYRITNKMLILFLLSALIFAITLFAWVSPAVTLVLLSCLSYALAANYIKYYVKTDNIILLAAVSATASTILIFAYKCLISGLSVWHLPTTFSQYLALMWLGVVSSGCCIYLYCLLIKRIGPEISSSITVLMIISGIIIGWSVAGDPFNWLTVLGYLSMILLAFTMSKCK